MLSYKKDGANGMSRLVGKVWKEGEGFKSAVFVFVRLFCRKRLSRRRTWSLDFVVEAKRAKALAQTKALTKHLT